MLEEEQPLLAPSFLFHFALTLKQAEWNWTDAKGASPQLSPEHGVPCLRQLEGRTAFAEVRGAWSSTGVLFHFEVHGKAQEPWCRPSRMSESDGVQIWLATRDTQNIHRAGRFCHRFVFLPSGYGESGDQPFAAPMPIARARETPADPPEGSLRVHARRLPDGYVLQALIGAEALTSYDPAEHPRLMFAYAITDRELGWQTLTVGPEFPFADDPSLWTMLELAAE